MPVEKPTNATEQSGIRNPECDYCHFGISSPKPPRNVCLLPEHIGPHDVMLVAEQPTKHDDIYGEVFSGRGLADIKAFLEDRGADVYATYAIKCAKPDKNTKSKPANAKLCGYGAAAKKGAPVVGGYLAQELKLVMPKHIICMGANTFVAVTGRATGFGDLKSSRYFDQRLNAYVYATEHHAAALFNNQVKDALIADLKRFVGWMQTPKEKVEAIEFNPPIHIASTLRSLRIMQRKIREAGGIVAVDTETQGLNPYIPGKQIRCIQFCWDAAFGGVFVPLGLEEDCFFTRPSMQHNYWQEGETLEEAVEIVREILLESQCIWHSGKFDRIWLHEWGQREFGAPILAPNIYMDTLHVAHAINENRSLKLKQLITTELGYPTYDINDKLTKDLDILIPYSTRDTVASLLLALKYSGILKSDDMQRVRRLYAKVTRRCDPVFTKMELRGWPVNGKTAAECKKTINAKLDETEAAMLKCLRKWTDGMVEAGLQGVDKETEEPLPVDTALFASTKKLSKLLFVVMRLPMNPDKSVSLTDGGEPSTDEDALIHLKGDEFVDLLLEWRGLVKALSTYVEPMIRAAKGRGRLTTSYRLTGTVTGRTASGKEATQSKRQGSSKVEGMNLQNLPYTWDIRNCIEAREGWSILEADFSQIELRIAGWLAKDPLLLKAYSLGWDIHAVRAMRVNGLSQEEWNALPKKKQKDLRKKAKAVNFGFLYGMQARKFKMYALIDYELDIPYKECVETRNQFFDDHTGLPGWYERQENECVRKGYVESPDGRRRHLPNIRHNPELSRDARTKYNEAVRMAINCLDFETEALTQRGWIKGPNLTLDDQLLTKNIESGELEWHQPLDVKVFADYTGPVTEFKSKSFNAISTGDHRWAVYNAATERDECKTTAQVARSYGGYRIHRTGTYKGTSETRWSDDEVRLIGWFLTDGYDRSGKRGIGLCQSKPQTVAGIDALMERLNYSYHRFVSKVGEVFWDCHASDRVREIKALCPERCLTYELLQQLTASQLVLLRDTMMLGCGSTDAKQTFHCGTQRKADMFQMLCTLTGIAANARYRDMSSYQPKLSAKMTNSPRSTGYWVITLLKRDKVQVIPEQVVQHQSSNGVWCPMVPNTYFVARRRGQVFITGNTPVQGFASDLKLMSMIEIDGKLEDRFADSAFLFGEVHDSILLEVRNDVIEEVAKMVLRIMSHPQLLDELGIEVGVPITAEAKVGQNYGQAKEYEVDWRGAA